MTVIVDTGPLVALTNGIGTARFPPLTPTFVSTAATATKPFQC